MPSFKDLILLRGENAPVPTDVDISRPVHSRADYLCSQCNDILLPSPGMPWSHVLGTVQDVRRRAEAGCQFCALVMRCVIPNIRGSITLSTVPGSPGQLSCILGPDGKRKTSTNSKICLSVKYSQSLDIYRQWDSTEARQCLAKCVKSHKCGSAKDMPLPTRLIDVGHPGTDRVRLFIPALEGVRVGRYFALSYCWGAHSPFTTSPSTLNSRIQGFSVLDLPATLRDAVQVTRDLGFSFLWIDALCILQGPESAAQEDWLRESACMQTVYGNAFLTIIAAGAWSCDGGLVDAVPSCTLPFKLEGLHGVSTRRDATITLDRSTYTPEFKDEPINNRAWALQEWLLSPRLLIFTSSKVQVNCNVFVSDTFNFIYKYRFPQPPHALKGKDWYIIVANFGGRDLTQARDKLPAISGLAAKFSELSGGGLGRYLAGLWETTLLSDLLWRYDTDFQAFCSRSKAGRCNEYRAPSWSWASIDGNVRYTVSPDSIEGLCAKVIRCDVELATAERFGMVKSGKLVIRGPWHSVSAVSRIPDSSDHLKLSDAGGNHVASLMVDDKDEIDMIISETDDLRFLCIKSHKKESSGLGLVKSGEEDGTFRRVGTFVSMKKFFLPGVREDEFTIV